jgi:hypothetical protein
MSNNISQEDRARNLQSLIIACAIKEGFLIVNTSDAIADNRRQTKMCERINR